MFKDEYAKIYKNIEPEIKLVKEELVKKINIEKELQDKLFELLQAPSKHIRTVVSFLYLKALGLEINEKQIIYQSAIELVHNASLIHDDIIDESKTRRTIKTINHEFGNKLAVITGDFLLSVALKKIRTLKQSEIIDMFAQTLDDMCQGEIQQQFSKFKISTIEEYIKKTELKTAKLFETAICGSLIIAQSDIQAKNFANCFGIAFQIRDDLINIKTSKTDIKDGIYTAPVILSSNTENFETGIEKTEILLNNYIDKTKKELSVLPENNYKNTLINLVELLKYE